MTDDLSPWKCVVGEGARLKREQLYREIGELPEPHQANITHTYYKLFMFLDEDLATLRRELEAATQAGKLLIDHGRREIARAEAAEARSARLSDALSLWADWIKSGRAAEMVRAMDATRVALSPTETPAPRDQWQPIETAPRDGTLLQLLIQQDEDHGCGFDDDDVTRTMGFNNFDNDEIDEWKFPGWSWTHDCINEQGHGTPIAWALMLPLPDAPDRRATLPKEAESGEK